MAAVVDCAAQAGTEGQHQLEALPGDHAGGMHLGVVEYSGGNAQSSLEGSLHVEALPLHDKFRQYARAGA